jgi:hypothetical protein
MFEYSNLRRRDPAIDWSRVSQNLGDNKTFQLEWVTTVSAFCHWARSERRNNAEIMQEIFVVYFICHEYYQVTQ